MPCGSVSTSSYPCAAHTNASAIPVLPLVASTIVVRPGSIRPSRSAASIIDTPIRSLTLPPGLKASSLANSSTSRSPAIRLSASIGVRPTSSEISIGIRGNSSGNPTESRGRDGARARRAARLGQPRLPTSACATGPAEVPKVLESTHGAAVIDPIDRLGRMGSRPASSTEGVVMAEGREVVEGSGTDRRQFLGRAAAGVGVAAGAGGLQTLIPSFAAAQAGSPTSGDIAILGAAQIAEALAVTTYTNIIQRAPFFRRP